MIKNNRADIYFFKDRANALASCNVPIILLKTLIKYYKIKRHAKKCQKLYFHKTNLKLDYIGIK